MQEVGIVLGEFPAPKVLQDLFAAELEKAKLRKEVITVDCDMSEPLRSRMS